MLTQGPVVWTGRGETCDVNEASVNVLNFWGLGGNDPKRASENLTGKMTKKEIFEIFPEKDKQNFPGHALV